MRFSCSIFFMRKFMNTIQKNLFLRYNKDKEDVMENIRMERDSLGEVEIKSEAYYGANSQRALENFHITGQSMDPFLVRAIVEVKKACAIENNKVGILSARKKDAIVEACDRILAGEFMDNFVVDPIQGGAGTSFNMNVNEVIANIANEILGGGLGTYEYIHPNDHVNKGQSTNDVIPSAGKIALIRYIGVLKIEVDKLITSFEKKAKEFDYYIKMGRTQLQDAVPIKLGQEFKAYATVISRDYKRLGSAVDQLSYLNLGGTAIGTGLNADDDFIEKVVPTLSKICELDLKQAEDLVDATQNLDSFLYTSSVLKTMACNLSKISNDLRLLSSGPTTGISDYNLPAKQAGSSIMPGKVNPVIPEVVNQVAFLVIGNDMTVTMAVEGGQLELNAFEPIIFYSLFESIKSLTSAISTLYRNCVDGITSDKEKLEKRVENSIAIITPFAPHIGYDKASKVAKESLSTGVSVREILLRDNIMTKEEIDNILDYESMTHPGILDEAHINKD